MRASAIRRYEITLDLGDKELTRLIEALDIGSKLCVAGHKPEEGAMLHVLAAELVKVER